MVQDENFYGDPTVNRPKHQWEQTQQKFLAQSGTLGAASTSSALGKHPRNPKPYDTSNRHEITHCHGCGRTGHSRDTCDLSCHPDFNRHGSWAGSAAEIAIRAHLRASAPKKKYPNVRLYKHLRADGTTIAAPQHHCDITTHTVLLYVLFCLTHMYRTYRYITCFPCFPVEVSSSTYVLS